MRETQFTPALQAGSPLSKISIQDFIDFCKNIPMISSVFSRDVKDKLGINNKSDLTGLKYS